jgi:hypothetical protein
MARFSAQVDSAAGVAVDIAFAALVPGAAVAFKLRRVRIGCVAAAGAPNSQQLAVGINRGTVRGVATTVPGQRLDPRSAASGIAGMDAAWSTAPTFSVNADQFRIAFNSQSGADLTRELLEEFASDIANPLVFVNRDNALPAFHSYVLSVEWEE